jgi:hypothetical protein
LLKQIATENRTTGNDGTKSKNDGERYQQVQPINPIPIDHVTNGSRHVRNVGITV